MGAWDFSRMDSSTHKNYWFFSLVRSLCRLNLIHSVIYGYLRKQFVYYLFPFKSYHFEAGDGQQIYSSSLKCAGEMFSHKVYRLVFL